MYVLESFTTVLAYSFHIIAIEIHYINVAPYSSVSGIYTKSENNKKLHTVALTYCTSRKYLA